MSTQPPRDREQNRLSARVGRYARVGANMGGLAAKIAGARVFGYTIDNEKQAAELAAALGGLGDDSMTGGAGRDTFVWRAGDNGSDTISDFHIDPAGVTSDVLDLSELLSGVDADSATLDNYLTFAFGNDTVISVSVTPGGAPVQDITLAGVDLADLYGTTNEAAVIDSLLADNALKVDNT